MKPKPWNKGDPITASRLNDMREESLRARRQFISGPGSSMVAENLGNQRSQAHDPGSRLVVATADFAVENLVTDIYSINDPQYQGMCQNVRLDVSTGLYEQEDLSQEFLVWDPMALLTGSTSKLMGDFFYVTFNKDTHRWEVLPSGTSSTRLVPAIVISCLTGGWHEVMITDWDECPSYPASESASASASGSDNSPCHICLEVDNTDTSCESITDVIIDRTTGATTTDEIVYAHTTNLKPMMIGGLIKMLKRVRTCTGSASGSDDIITDDVYDVVDGVWPLIALPFPQYECCTDPDTGAQTVQLVGCSRAVVEGYVCDEEPTPCPTGSGSASV